MYPSEDEPGTDEFRNYPLTFLHDIINKEVIAPPFDADRVISDNPYSFGALNQSARIGRWAKFLGGEAFLNDEALVLPPQYGRIVGDDHGRIVLSFEGTYLGWLNPECFEIIDVHPDFDPDEALPN